MEAKDSQEHNSSIEPCCARASVACCLAVMVWIMSGCGISTSADEAQDASFMPVNIAGEVTQHSVILQSRLGARTSLERIVVTYEAYLQARQDGNDAEADLGSISGNAGWGYFEISTDSTFARSSRTGWLQATPNNDYILKTKLDSLSPGQRYYYRVRSGSDSTNLTTGRTATFQTLPATDSRTAVDFVMISCPNFEKFYGIGERSDQRGNVEWAGPATGRDRRLGYPGFEVMSDLQPDFWIGNGDNVYYDEPDDAGDPTSATTHEELRAKWHRTFAMPRFRRVLDRMPGYFLKDDHDYRFNDADTTDRQFEKPSHELGIATFREQVPVADPSDPAAKTYRTYRVNELLQIWLLENRDYRSPNNIPDGSEKTLWGEAQKEWLKRTLLASDATFKIIVTPTPEVGPDDDYKQDNHVGGFVHEGEAFKAWLAEQNLTSPEVFTITGDRHWQYHSMHSTGLEEFAAGAFNSQNSREGVPPGDASGTDSQGRIEQPYLQSPPVGGFLHVRVDPSSVGNRPSILFTHYSEHGDVLNAVRRYAPAAEGE